MPSATRPPIAAARRRTPPTAPRGDVYQPGADDTVSMICCPCWPMARAAALLGRSYLGTWLLIMVLYVGGIVGYSVMHIVDEPEFSPVPFTLGPTAVCIVSALIALCLNVIGAPLAIVFLLLQAFGRVVLIQDPYSVPGLLLV